MPSVHARVRRKRPRAAGDPDVRPPHAPVAHQRADDPPRRGVDRHREPEADAGDRGVDPDHLGRAVDQRPAGVARVQRRVGLDHVVDVTHRAAGARRQRAPERGHDAGGDRAGEPVRVADRDDQLPDAQPPRPRRAPRGSASRRRRAARRGRTAGRRRRPGSAAPGRRRTTPDRCRPGPATTCAEVSRNPSGVSATALPAPAGTCPPPRARRITRRFATDGASRSATSTTMRE